MCVCFSTEIIGAFKALYPRVPTLPPTRALTRACRCDSCERPGFGLKLLFASVDCEDILISTLANALSQLLILQHGMNLDEVLFLLHEYATADAHTRAIKRDLMCNLQHLAPHVSYADLVTALPRAYVCGYSSVKDCFDAQWIHYTARHFMRHYTDATTFDQLCGPIAMMSHWALHDAVQTITRAVLDQSLLSLWMTPISHWEGRTPRHSIHTAPSPHTPLVDLNGHFRDFMFA